MALHGPGGKIKGRRAVSRPLAPRAAKGHPSRMDWLKIIHILCVMGWMTSIFAVPRALIYWKREHAKLGGFGPLGDLTIRLYRFSAGLGVIAVATGLWLGWQVWSFAPWVHVKLTLVLLLALHYIWTGVLVRRAKRGEFRESDLFLRIFNEISVVAVIAILWVVVVKPF
jgi:putative membrane protein